MDEQERAAFADWMLNQKIRDVMFSLTEAPIAPECVCLTGNFAGVPYDVVCVIAKGELAEQVRQHLQAQCKTTVLGMSSPHRTQ